jgi:hypothetical protein
VRGLRRECLVVRVCECLQERGNRNEETERDKTSSSARDKILGGLKEIFRRHRMQIGIIQVKVDGLERSKQHRNMHRLSTCDRDRCVTDTVPQTRSQISQFGRGRADSIRSLRHAGTCKLPPDCHSWAIPPPRGTATCETGVQRQPQDGSRHNHARPQPRTMST